MPHRSQGEPAPKRGLRAGLALPPAQTRRDGAERTRRGSLTTEDAVWRRCEMGTNHIACFGIWRCGTRRQAERLNRAGLTRWHMPRQGSAGPILATAPARGHDD